VLNVDKQHRHPSTAVSAALNAIECALNPDSYARVHTLFLDLFVVILPLLRELDVELVRTVLAHHGEDVVERWCRRAVSLLDDTNNTIQFYTHLLLHWCSRFHFSSSLPTPLTPAHFGQDSDESAWRVVRRNLLSHSTFNGGYSALALSSPAAVQMLQRALELFIVRWFLRLPLLPASFYRDDDIDRDGDGDDDDDADHMGTNHGIQLAQPPASFRELIAWLSALRRHYLPAPAAQQQQQVVAAITKQPVVPQTAINNVVLDARARASQLQSPLPPLDTLLSSLRDNTPAAKRQRFDEQREDISQRLQHTISHTVDVTKLKDILSSSQEVQSKSFSGRAVVSIALRCAGDSVSSGMKRPCVGNVVASGKSTKFGCHTR
jgi:hypothetical protein